MRSRSLPGNKPTTQLSRQYVGSEFRRRKRSHAAVTRLKASKWAISVCRRFAALSGECGQDRGASGGGEVTRGDVVPGPKTIDRRHECKSCRDGRRAGLVNRRRIEGSRRSCGRQCKHDLIDGPVTSAKHGRRHRARTPFAVTAARYSRLPASTPEPGTQPRTSAHHRCEVSKRKPTPVLTQGSRLSCECAPVRDPQLNQTSRVRQ